MIAQQTILKRFLSKCFHTREIVAFCSNCPQLPSLCWKYFKSTLMITVVTESLPISCFLCDDSIFFHFLWNITSMWEEFIKILTLFEFCSKSMSIISKSRNLINWHFRFFYMKIIGKVQIRKWALILGFLLLKTTDFDDSWKKSWK